MIYVIVRDNPQEGIITLCEVPVYSSKDDHDDNG